MPRQISVNSGLLRFRQDISVGPHAFRADESREHGGNDAGPDPHELLLAALGACASTTVQMYAQRKQWPLDAVHVHLSYVMTPRENGANANSASADTFEMELSFSGNLSDEQRGRLLEIAARCLPEHIYVVLNFPHTAKGSIDRQALAAQFAQANAPVSNGDLNRS